jgi:hypothetical protein
MKVTLRNVRLAFPQLFEAKTVNGEGKPAYSASFLFAPAHPQLPEIKAAIESVARDKWGAKAAGTLKELYAAGKVCLQDGDRKASYDGFEGNYYISARNPVRPLVADRDKTPLGEQDGRVYAGCYVYAVIELWAQDNGWGKRINATLRTVQFFRDGDAFTGGGAPPSEDELEDLSVGADAGAELV